MRHSKRILSLALVLALCLGLSIPALAAEEETAERGVLTYEEVIAPQYEAAQPFGEDLAAVKKDGKWGYIDETGAVVIPFQYDRAYIFNEGYAIVGNLLETSKDIDWVWNEETGDYDEVMVTYGLYEFGFIDKEGTLTWFEEDYYDWETETEGTRHGQGWISVDDGYKPHDLLFQNGYFFLTDHLYDTTGKDVRDSLASGGDEVYIYDSPINEGMAVCYNGYFDITTKKHIQIESYFGQEYPDMDVRPFNQGMAPACEYLYEETDDGDYYGTALWGFVDKQGRWVIPPQYDNWVVYGSTTNYVIFGETGLAMVADGDGNWGAIDKTGNTVIPFEYDWLWNYHFGLCPFLKDGKWGYLDEKGNVVLAAQYEDTSGFGSDGYAVVYDGAKAYLIDSKGNAVPGADSLDPDTYFQSDENGIKSCLLPTEYVVIQKDGKYGYGHIDYKPALPEPAAVSSWAYDEVVAAIEEDLVPNYLQNLYQRNITRDEFCDLIVQAVSELADEDIETLVLEKTGKSLDERQHEYPFTDTTSSNVIAANALGIVNGRGNGVFDPYATITRQEAAALLMRAAGVLGLDTGNVESAGFADSGEVGEWFVAAVNYVNQINVMTGTGENQFTPLGTYSREQSFMTVYRLFLNVVEQ